MRSLKKLLAVIVAICVLATFTIPAFAADSATYANADQATKLNSMGLYAGISTTSFDPDLGSTLTREQGMVILLKMFGQLDAANAMTDADTDAALAAFTDAKDLSSWAKKAFAYVVKNSISSGTSETTLGPKGTFTGNQFATLILKEAGFTVADWTTAAADLTTKGVAGAGALATTVLTRDQLVGMAFGALTVNNAAGKTIVAALVEAGKVTAASAVAAGVYSDTLALASASATGAKTVKVVFNRAVADTTKVAVTVKRDGSKVNFTSTTWNDAKTEVTLGVSYKLYAGSYVVSATEGTTELAALPAFKVEDEKIASITFNSDIAVLKGADKQLTTSIVIKNQYGEDITNNYDENDLNIVASKSSVDPTLTDGVVQLEDANVYAVGDKVNVTIIDPNSTVVSTKTLTVSASIDVASIALGDVATAEDSTAIHVADLTADDKYWLPLTVTDQYGNTITDEATLEADLTVIGSNDAIIGDLTNKTIANLIGTEDDKPVLYISEGTAVEAGNVNLTVVSKSGKSASKTVSVLEDTVVDKLTLSKPDGIVKEGKEIQIPFQAVDKQGNVMTKAEGGLGNATLSAGNTVLSLGDAGDTTITVTSGTIAASIDYLHDNALVIKVTPADADKKTVLVASTPTAQVNTLTLSVEAAPEIQSITGLSSDFYLGMQEGKTQTLNATLVKFADQYGDSIDYNAADTLVATNDSGNTNVDMTAGGDVEAGVTCTATTGSTGTTKYTLTLKDAGGDTVDTYSFTMINVPLKDITEFGVEDLNKIYTGTVNPDALDYDQTISIYGKKGSTDILVNQNLLVAATSPVLTIAGATIANGSNDIDTSGADKTTTVTAAIAGADGIVYATKNVTYSSATPKAQSLVLKDSDDNEVADPTVVEDLTGYNNAVAGAGTATEYRFVAVDQYNVEAGTITYYISNGKDSAGDPLVAAKTNALSIATDGEITGDADLVAGDSFVITAIKDGLSKSVRIVLQ